jgi:hypothetical protein
MEAVAYPVNFNNVWTVNYVHPAVKQQRANEDLRRAVDCTQDEGIFDVGVFCP